MSPLQNTWRKVCIILLLTVIILFEIVQTKIAHYSSLAYFPMTFLAALSIYRIGEGKLQIARITRILLVSLGAVLVMAIVGLTYVGDAQRMAHFLGLDKGCFCRREPAGRISLVRPGMDGGTDPRYRHNPVLPSEKALGQGHLFIRAGCGLHLYDHARFS